MTKSQRQERAIIVLIQLDDLSTVPERTLREYRRRSNAGEDVAVFQSVGADGAAVYSVEQALPDDGMTVT